MGQARLLGFTLLLAVRFSAGCASRVAPLPASAVTVASTAVPAQLIIRSARIEPPSGKMAVVDIVVADGKIVSASNVPHHVGSQTRVIEGDGHTVIGGLTDAHVHLAELGASARELDLRCDNDAQSDEAATANCIDRKLVALKIVIARDAWPAEKWVRGRGWDQNRLPRKQFPTHAQLDRVFAERPVWLVRVDGHAGWANATALRLAHIDRTTKDPTGGKILRAASGAPTGVLIDNAMALVEKVMPPATDAEVRADILAGQSIALRDGLTEVHDMGLSEQLVRVYEALDQSGALRIRIVGFFTGDEAAITARLQHAPPPPGKRFRLAGIKLFADGALGSRGAALLAPYHDDASTSGLELISKAAIARIAKLACATGWQLAVHAIGDRGVRNVIDAYETAGCAARARFRIEHLQVFALDDLPRLQKLHVIASMQPTHATSDMPWAEARLGAARLPGAYAWRRVLDAGLVLAFGSDAPVEDINPLFGIYAATTRKDASGNPDGGWHAEEALDFTEAVRAFTIAPAYAAFEDGKRGAVAPHERADLTVFDRDLRAATPAELRAARVLYTFIDGACEYDASAK